MQADRTEGIRNSEVGIRNFSPTDPSARAIPALGRDDIPTGLPRPGRRHAISDLGFGTCHGVVRRTKPNFDYVGGIWPSRLPAVSGCPPQEEGLSPAEVIICCTRFSRTGTSS
jgi:hypothetical protein